MYYELYIDSLFCSDFIMNFSLLCLTGHFCGKSATFWRKALSAAYGAGIFCVIFLLPVKGRIPALLPGLFLSLAGMVWIAFRIKKKQLLKAAAIMAGTAFFQGGIYLFLRSRIPLLWEDDRVILPALTAGVISYVAGKILIKKSRKKEQLFCRVKLQNGEREVEVDALIDTGNFLTEPISGKPVSVLKEEVISELFGGSLPEYYRVIPFCSIGKTRGILRGFEIPKMWIEYQEECLVYEKIMVAECSELQNNDSCTMILNPKLINSQEE